MVTTPYLAKAAPGYDDQVAQDYDGSAPVLAELPVSVLA